MDIVKVFDIRAIHVVGGLDRRFGGPSYSIPRLCEAVSEQGVGFDLLSVANEGAVGSVTGDEGSITRLFPWDFARTPIIRDLRMSRKMLAALRMLAPQTDIIHNHGLWLLPNVYAGNTAQMSNRPLIVAPRGMLGGEALSYSKYRKSIFWQMFQKNAFERAFCYHATSYGEYEDIRRFQIRSPVAVIPNGVDIPKQQPRRPCCEEKTLLYLGRLHPIKGLPNLIKAWAAIEPDAVEWRLRLVGPDESGHAAELVAQIRELGLNSVSIEQPVYGEEKTKRFQEATVTISPSFQENFGLTVAESLAAGRPVIATKGSPWSDLEAKGCGWWVDNDPQSLRQAIKQAMAKSDLELAVMGDKGRMWVERDFSWDAIGKMTFALYAWAAGTASRPPFVLLD